MQTEIEILESRELPTIVWYKIRFAYHHFAIQGKWMYLLGI